MLKLEEIIKKSLEIDANDIHITAGSSIAYRKNKRILEREDDYIISPQEIDNILEDILNDNQKKELKIKKQLLISSNLFNLGRFRMSISKQRGSYYIVIKVGNSIEKIENFEFIDSINELYKLNSGLIILSGPAGSGRSTTSAYLLNKINNNYHKNIITVENPIEYLFKHKKSIIKQKEIGLDIDTHFQGIEFSFKEDADVIYLDELPDKETIYMAIRAAEQGMLVIATLYTRDAYSTIQYIIDSCPENQMRQIKLQLANSLKAVISQQLITKEDGNIIPCFEVVLINNALKRLILEDKLKQIYSLITAYEAMGMISMDEYIAKLIREGKISKDEGICYSSNSKRLVSILNSR